MNWIVIGLSSVYLSLDDICCDLALYKSNLRNIFKTPRNMNRSVESDSKWSQTQLFLNLKVYQKLRIIIKIKLVQETDQFKSLNQSGVV